MAAQQKSPNARSGETRRSTGRSTAKDTGAATAMSRRDRPQTELGRRDLWRDPWSASPFGLWRTWTDQMDRFFNSFGLGAAGNRIGDWNMWNPQIETFQRGDELVIRADLPGLSKDDVNVEITDDAVILSGERRDEFEDNREGLYRSERSYGSFYRSIPLPEGAIGDNAKANFKDGVLEITMPAPPREATRGRRIEIGEGTSERPASRAGSRGRPQTENMPPNE